VLRRGLQALRLDIGGMLVRRLRALRLSITQVALISLASEAWTLLSDNLSSVIFRQSTSISDLRIFLLVEDELFEVSKLNQVLEVPFESPAMQGGVLPTPIKKQYLPASRRSGPCLLGLGNLSQGDA